jgi:hypothetical protein
LLHQASSLDIESSVCGSRDAGGGGGGAAVSSGSAKA